MGTLFHGSGDFVEPVAGITAAANVDCSGINAAEPGVDESEILDFLTSSHFFTSGCRGAHKCPHPDAAKPASQRRLNDIALDRTAAVGKFEQEVAGLRQQNAALQGMLTFMQ